MKLLIFTDIHHWEDFNHTKIWWEDYINTFWDIFEQSREKIKEIIEKNSIDFIVNLWDLIRETKNRDADIWLYKEWLQILNSFWLPILNVTWNHDVDHEMDRKTIWELNWYGGTYYSIELWWYSHIVLDWNREWKINWEMVWWQIYRFDENQISWLEKTLNSTDNNCIIYCHYPIDEQDISDNPYWPTWDTTRVFPQNYLKIREIIEKSWKVLAYFNWHTHFPHVSLINGIIHCNVWSFSENNWNAEASKEYAIVEVIDKNIKIALKRL